MASPYLSVVVPTLNEEASIGPVIDRILDASGLDTVDLHVVDGGSNDRTVEIASRRAHTIQGPRGRARQMNAGSRHAIGQVILYCHGDTLLPPGYGLAVQRVLGISGVVGGAFQHRWDAPNVSLRLLEAFVSLPFKDFMFGDQGLFARRADLEALGFYPDIPLMEDVWMAQALARRGRMVRLRASVLTSARRFLERGPLRQMAFDLTLYVAFRLGADPVRLAEAYRNTRRDRRPSTSAS